MSQRALIHDGLALIYERRIRLAHHGVLDLDHVPTEQEVRALVSLGNAEAWEDALGERQDLNPRMLDPDRVLLFLQGLPKQPVEVLDQLNNQVLPLDESKLRLSYLSGFGAHGFRGSWTLTSNRYGWFGISPEVDLDDAREDLGRASAEEKKRRAVFEEHERRIRKKQPLWSKRVVPDEALLDAWWDWSTLVEIALSCANRLERALPEGSDERIRVAAEHERLHSAKRYPRISRRGGLTRRSYPLLISTPPPAPPRTSHAQPAPSTLDEGLQVLRDLEIRLFEREDPSDHPRLSENEVRDHVSRGNGQWWDVAIGEPQYLNAKMIDPDSAIAFLSGLARQPRELLEPLRGRRLDLWQPGLRLHYLSGFGARGFARPWALVQRESALEVSPWIDLDDALADLAKAGDEEKKRRAAFEDLEERLRRKRPFWAKERCELELIAAWRHWMPIVYIARDYAHWFLRAFPADVPERGAVQAELKRLELAHNLPYPLGGMQPPPTYRPYP